MPPPKYLLYKIITAAYRAAATAGKIKVCDYNHIKLPDEIDHPGWLREKADVGVTSML